MDTIAHFTDVNFTNVATGETRTKDYEPEPVSPARPMVGLLGLMTEEEVRHALAYDGPQDLGDEGFSLAAREPTLIPMI